MTATTVITSATTYSSERWLGNVVHASIDLEPGADVWLIDHCWGFDSVADASQQLAMHEQVGMRLLQLLGLDGEDHECFRSSVIMNLLDCINTMPNTQSGGECYYIRDELGSSSPNTKLLAVLCCST